MSESQATILVIDDERDVVELLRILLESVGYHVLCAYDGYQGIDLAKQERPDLIILDVMMPGKSGYEVCQELRTFSDTPILMLTAKIGRDDTINGLESGADDYVTKPYDPEVLLARVKALLRRKPAVPTLIERANGELQIDRLRREVTIRGQQVELTPIEYQLLLVLAERAGEVLTHEYLLEQVWGEERGGDNDSLKVYIWHLRRKIEENPKAPQTLLTEWGVGYKLAP